MRNRKNVSHLIGTDRKALYIILTVVLASVFTLTVVYASLSTTLNINGTTEVTAAAWDIYLDNVVLNNQSATSNVPTITNKKTASFSTTLSKPGDFYEFTIDVVNNGTIDAMIDSVTKTPELTANQAKYLNYVVEYQNGEAITTKQLVSKNSFVRLKVKVEFRKDISATDLPNQAETLNLSFKVNYVQSDDSSENATIDNNGKLIKVVSGDYNTVGSEICIRDECFYVISSDEDSVTMFAKYNLYVGGTYEGSTWTEYGDNGTGIQDISMLGIESDGLVRKGTTKFSPTNYWYDGSILKQEYGTSYPTYVYDSNSVIFNYIKNYKLYLENLIFMIEEARLVSLEELDLLGCSIENTSCSEAPTWVYKTSYWTGTAGGNNNIWRVDSFGGLYNSTKYLNFYDTGVRPVIKVLKSVF